MDQIRGKGCWLAAVVPGAPAAILYGILLQDAGPYLTAVTADEAAEEAAYTENSASLAGAQERISHLGFLQEKPCQASIGEEINHRLAWSPDYLALPWRKEREVETELLPLIAGKVRELRKMRYRGKEFFWSSSKDFRESAGVDTYLEKAGLSGLDTSWMDPLADSSSCWDISANSPRTAYFPMDPLELPEPSYTEFSAWAVLRLLHGIRDGDGERALRTARSWARLLFSTQRLAGAAAGNLLLVQEEIAGERMQRMGLETGGWSPVPEQQRRVGP